MAYWRLQLLCVIGLLNTMREQPIWQIRLDQARVLQEVLLFDSAMGGLRGQLV
jgi:hypothetical protein